MKGARVFLVAGVFAALSLLWVGIQGLSCDWGWNSAVEAYFLNGREVRINGDEVTASTHQITLTMAVPESGLKVIIRNAEGALLAIGRSEP